MSHPDRRTPSARQISEPIDAERAPKDTRPRPHDSVTPRPDLWILNIRRTERRQPNPTKEATRWTCRNSTAS